MRQSFDEFFRELRRGMANVEATEKLMDCIDHAKKTGKPTTLTLTLKISPSGNDRVIVADVAKNTLPEATHPDTMFFFTDDGISRRDPRQMSLSDID